MPTLEGKGGGTVLGCKSPVLSFGVRRLRFGAVAIQQPVLVDGNIFALWANRIFVCYFIK